MLIKQDVDALIADDTLDAAAEADREAAELAERLAELRTEAANAPARSRELTAQLEVDRQRSLREWQALNVESTSHQTK